MLLLTVCASWQATNLARSGKDNVFVSLDAVRV